VSEMASACLPLLLKNNERENRYTPLQSPVQSLSEKRKKTLDAVFVGLREFDPLKIDFVKLILSSLTS